MDGKMKHDLKRPCGKRCRGQGSLADIHFFWMKENNSIVSNSTITNTYDNSNSNNTNNYNNNI